MKSIEFKNHPIHQKVLELKARCNHEKTKETIDAEILLMIKTHCQFLTDRLQLAMLPLVNADELNAIQHELQSALINISEYLNDGNVGRIQSTKQHMANALPLVRNIPYLVNKADFNFSEISANYSDYIDTKIDIVQDSISKLNMGIKASENLFQEQQQIIESLRTQLNEQQLQTNEIANSFRISLQLLQQDYEQKGILTTNAHRQLFEEAQVEFELQAQNLIDEIAAKRDKARQMLNVIGQEGTAAHYLNTAKKHTETANLFRWISLVLMLIICVFILFMILSNQSEFNWQRYALRLVSISIFIYPATYAAMESNKHRILAHQRETAAVELVSIEPFIELLDEAKKQEIKEKLAEKYFGNGHQQSHQGNVNVKDAVPLDIFERLVKLIRLQP